MVRKKIFKTLLSLIVITFLLYLSTSDWKNMLLFLKGKKLIYIIWLIESSAVIYMTFLLQKGHDKIIYVLISTYASLLIITLFNREPLETRMISDSTYIKKWLSLLFSNRIIFINLIGNIVLFIPLGSLLPNLIKNKSSKLILECFFLSFLIVGSLELLQFILKRGVLDIIDIVCNMIGVSIGIFITMINKTINKKMGGIKNAE